MTQRCYTNPAFHLEPAAVEADLARMRASPQPLHRPVVILGGWHSPGIANWGVGSLLWPCTSGRRDDFLSITYPWRLRLRSAAGAAHRQIASAGLAGSDIDLIGISMGGLLARALAGNVFGLGPLRVRRVFTIASPHRGATIARVVFPDPAAWDMRPGSKFLARLNEAAVPYELHCYGALRDWWISAGNTAPPGIHPHWVDVAPGLGRLCTHFAINREKRVIVDIARRLRGEEPVAKEAGCVPRW